jgi:GEVED domain/Ig-like domain CHU_C associated/SprB repeat
VGGTAPYTYDWSNNGTQMPDTDLITMSGVAAGNYTVTVTDANGCTVTTIFTIAQPPALVANAVFVAQGSCTNPSDGIINLTVSGGAPGLSPGYTFDWSNITGTNNPEDQSGIGAGTYTVTATDGNGCTITTSVTVNAISGLAASIVSVTGANCVATFNLVTTGGTTPITYDWSNDGPDDPDNDVEDLANVAAGTYTVTVTAANGCTAIASATYRGCDLGDLPDTGPGVSQNNYPTQNNDSGPSHEIVPGFYLGYVVDNEPNGQQNATASGDGTDEDGIALPVLTAGQTATIPVRYAVPVGPNATIGLMLDFNDDGNFTSGEIFTATVTGGTSGVQNFSVPVPANAVAGVENIGVRVRISTSSAAASSPTGSAPNGEIEDYLTVVNCPPIVLTVVPASVCSGSSIDLATLVTNSGGGTLSYYNTAADANAGTNVRTSSTVTPSGATNYYVRSQTTAGCFAVKEVTVSIKVDTCGTITITGSN